MCPWYWVVVIVVVGCWLSPPVILISHCLMLGIHCPVGVRRMMLLGLFSWISSRVCVGSCCGCGSGCVGWVCGWVCGWVSWVVVLVGVVIVVLVCGCCSRVVVIRVVRVSRVVVFMFGSFLVWVCLFLLV